MRKITLLSVSAFLLCGGMAVGAWAGRAAVPLDVDDGSGGSEPPANSVDLTKLVAMYQTVTDSVGDGAANRLYYLSASKSQAYADAHKAIDSEGKDMTQAQIDALAKSLKQQFMRSPLEYTSANIMVWYAEVYGMRASQDYTPAEYDETYANSDFNGLKLRVDSVLDDFAGKEDEIGMEVIYGDTLASTETAAGNLAHYGGVIAQGKECRDDAFVSFENKKHDLKSLVDAMVADQKYAAVMEKGYFIKAKSWFDTAPDFTYKAYNLTCMQIYANYLRDEMSFCALIAVYRGTASSVLNSAKKYFTPEEQVDTNEKWVQVRTQIDAFDQNLSSASMDAAASAFIYKGKTYASLREMQEVLNAEQSGIQSLTSLLAEQLDELKAELSDTISVAKKMLVLFMDAADFYSKLNTAVNAAERTLNGAMTYFSTFRQAVADLKAAYAELETYYKEQISVLEKAVGEAVNANAQYGDANLATAITAANTVLETAKAIEAKINDITKAATNVEEALKLATSRYDATLRADSLAIYIKVYGDEASEMQAMIDEMEGIASVDAFKKLSVRMSQKMKSVENEWKQAAQNLADKIVAANRYYDNWHEIKEGMDELKRLSDAAQAAYDANTQEKVRNIAALKKAYDELEAVYDKLGGYSDPYESRVQLSELIKEAEACQAKYNYDNLQLAINEARANLNSDTKYVLDQQIELLKTEIATTKQQYQLLVERMDKQLVTTSEKMTERYGETVPEQYTAVLLMVIDSLQVASEEADRLCTDIAWFQEKNRELRSMVTEVDASWQAAKDALQTAIQDAELKFNSNYPDNEDLENAIKQAKEQYAVAETQHKTIASVEQLRKDLDNALAVVEGADRRNIADQFIRIYRNVRDSFAIYGSDENTANTSGAKVWIEENQQIFEELSNAGMSISHSLAELDAWVAEAQEVIDAYTLFCNAARLLDATIAVGEQANGKYYGNGDETSNLYVAIAHAHWARAESFCQDSIEKSNYALKDSISQTERLYTTTLAALKSARAMAKSQHNLYYGSSVSDSEIMDVYEESAQFLSVYLLKQLDGIIAKLDTCYKQVAEISAGKEKEIQQLIDRVEILNGLMGDDQFDEQIATAINAKYSMDGRIAAIDENMKSLQAAYDGQFAKYEKAVEDLRSKLAEAENMLADRADSELAAQIELAKQVLARADVEAEAAATYAEVTEAAEGLSKIMEVLSQQIAAELDEARIQLRKAREVALEKHNFYYGVKNPESEIRKVYDEAEAYLTSDNLDEIRLMTDSVNNSYLDASVSCAKKEADLDNLIRKSNPLAVLMADNDFADMVKTAADCRNRMDGRIVAMDSISPYLQEAYDDNSMLYDEAVAMLNDSIIEAESLLVLMRDKALQTAVDEARKSLEEAGKTSVSSTKYAELLQQIKALAVEMERVRLLIVAVDETVADDAPVEIYTLQGYLVKKARLSDADAMRDIPDGIYIVNGKKMVLQKNNR